MNASELIEVCNSILEKPSDFSITSSDNDIIFSYAGNTASFIYLNDTLIPKSFPLSYHITRINENLIHMKNSYIVELFQQIIKIMIDPNKYCTICAELCDKTYCNPKCFNAYCCTATDSFVIDNYKRDSLSVIFLIKITLCCIRMDPGRRDLVFKPFPEWHTYESFDELAKTYSEKMFHCAAKFSENDQDLINKIGLNLYGVIKFILLTNKTYFRSEKITMNDKIIDDSDSLKIDDETQFFNFQIIHPPKVEEAFKTDTPLFLFHGSTVGNWHSILRNGLKNCSHTPLMSAGAARGSGIYLAKNIQTSIYYSAPGEDGLCIIGVAQIIDDHITKTYNKNGIYVIPDESKVLLRYLVLTNRKYTQNIQKYIMDDRTTEIANFNRDITSIVMKRITQEIKCIKLLNTKYPQLEDLKLIISENQNNMIINFGQKQIEVKLMQGYPSDPPFFRIVYPRIVGSTIVNNFGVITIPELSFNKWTAKTKISEIIIKIHELLKNCECVDGVYDYELAYTNYCDSILH